MQRRDQSCTQVEAAHLEDVKALGRTYDYLARLTGGEWRETINVFVLRNLPVTEKKARLDRAPPFCDEDGLGLPEPDPVIPKRPPSLR